MLCLDAGPINRSQFPEDFIGQGLLLRHHFITRKPIYPDSEGEVPLLHIETGAERRCRDVNGVIADTRRRCLSDSLHGHFLSSPGLRALHREYDPLGNRGRTALSVPTADFRVLQREMLAVPHRESQNGTYLGGCEQGTGVGLSPVGAGRNAPPELVSHAFISKAESDSRRPRDVRRTWADRGGIDRLPDSSGPVRVAHRQTCESRRSTATN